MKGICSIGLVAVLAAACGSGSSDDKANSDDTTGGEGGEGGTAAVGALALADISLSDSLTPPVPSQIKTDSGSALALTADKSLEQCLLRDAVSQMEMNIAQVTSQLCMFENDPNMVWGKAYNISFDFGGGGGGDAGPGGPGAPLTLQPPDDIGELPPDAGEDMVDIGDVGGDAGQDGGEGPDGDAGPDGGGGPGGPGGDDMDFSMPESIQVKMDDSKAADGVYTIWVCEDKTLTQKFEITGAKKGEGAKGTFDIKMSIGGDEMLLSGSFDNNVTKAGRYLSDMRMRFGFGGSDDNVYMKMNLGLKDDDIHFIRSGNEFGFGGQGATKELLAGRIGPDYGMALVQRTGGDQPIFGLQDGPETSRAYFDAAGNKVEKDASADFEKDGALFVTKEEMPRLLPEFKVDFGADAWNCEGTEDLDFAAGGGESSDIEKCFEGMDMQPGDFGCFGSGFAPGFPEEGIEDFTADDHRFDEGFQGGEFNDFPDEFAPPGDDVPPPGDEVPPSEG